MQRRISPSPISPGNPAHAVATQPSPKQSNNLENGFVPAQAGANEHPKHWKRSDL